MERPEKGALGVLRGSVLRGSVLRGSLLRGSLLRGSLLRGSVLLGTFLLGTFLLGSGRAEAQGEGGVAHSGMGQGEANISTRSDVRMSIESGAGTTGSKLQAMAMAVTSAMAAVRRCYADVTAEHPGVTGTMRVRVSLPRRGRAQLAPGQDTTGLASLARCAQGAIGRASFGAVRRPAIVTVRLDFTNTAAAGAAAVAERRAIEDRVEVTRGEDGLLEAQGGNASGEVRFSIRSVGDTGEEAVAAVQRTVRATIPGLLDCRRRAGRRGMDPQGAMVIELNVPRRGRVRARSVSSDLQDSRAPICVSRALSRARFATQAAGRVRVELSFAARRHLDVETR